MILSKISLYGSPVSIQLDGYHNKGISCAVLLPGGADKSPRDLFEALIEAIVQNAITFIENPLAEKEVLSLRKQI